MALKPQSIDRDDVRRMVAEAVRKRAPQSDLDGWYFRVQDGSGVGRDTTRSLCREETGSAPDTLTLLSYIAYFGDEFADEILAPLTGVRCTRDPDDVHERLKFLEQELAGLSAFAGGKDSDDDSAPRPLREVGR